MTLICGISERQMIQKIQLMCTVTRDWHNLLVSEEGSFCAVLLGVVHVDSAYVTHIFTCSFFYL